VHLPQRNETTTIGNFIFRVLYSDTRQVHLMRVSINKNKDNDAEKVA